MDTGSGREVPLTPRRAMITGGAGFIGSHITERLLEQGHTRCSDLQHLRPADAAGRRPKDGLVRTIGYFSEHAAQ